MVQELLRRKELLQRLHISNTTLYAWIAAGRFPRPIKPGPSGVALWLADDVDKWFAMRIAARGDPFRASA